MIYILAKHNFWQLVGKKEIVYKEAPDYILDYLSHHGSYLIQSDTRPTNAVLIRGTGFDYPTKDELGVKEKVKGEIPEDYEVVQFMGKCAQNAHVYRRFKLNDYLKKHYKVATIYQGNVDTSKCKFIIISDPRGADELVNSATCPIYYDKTDMWDALQDHVDDTVLDKAVKVFCSSKYIYDNTKHDNKILIENAANPYLFTPDYVKKENIAVYVGRADNKVDVDYCDKLRQEHPDYSFVSIGVEIPGFKHKGWMKYSEMMKYLEKCKVGLVPLKDNAYTAGQFNLKVWDYIQNKMPVIVTNDYNYSLKNVHTEWTETFVEEPIVYWANQFERIYEEIGIH